MKRLTVLTIFAILLASSASSQIRFGLRGGINTAYFDATKITTEEYQLTTLDDAQIGFHGGVMAQVSFFGLFLQPELLLTSVGSEVRVEDLENGAIDRIREQSFTKLDFPVLVGKRFGPARLGIGPVGTIMLNTDSELSEVGNMQVREEFNNATFGYQVGVGLDIFGRFAVDLKYEGNLTRLGSGITIGGQDMDFDSRSRQFIVSLGIFL